MKINLQIYSPSTEKCVKFLSLKSNDLRPNEGHAMSNSFIVINIYGGI